MINLGIIGGGVNSAVGAAHIAAIRMTGKFNILAGAFSRDSTTSIDSGRKYGVSMCYVDPSSMLDQRKFDRVVVLSPTPSHSRHVGAALRRGLPVLCEKALGSSSLECAAMKELSSTTAPLSVVYNYAFYPAFKNMVLKVRTGLIGEVKHITLRMPQSGFMGAALPQKWRMNDFGIYLDLGVHLHHLLSMLLPGFSAPDELQCMHRRFTSVGVVDYVAADMLYGDVHVRMEFNKCTPGETNGLSVDVCGDRGSVRWRQQKPDMLRWTDEGTTIVQEVPNPRFKAGHPTGFVEALANLYEAWAKDPAEPMLSPSHAVNGLLLMEAMFERAES